MNFRRCRPWTLSICGWALVLGTAGCPSRSPPANPNSPDQTEGASSKEIAPDSPEEACEKLVRSIRGTFQFRPNGLSEELSSGVNLLNQWQRSCRADKSAELKLSSTAAALLDDAFDAETRRGLRQPVFTMRDAVHLRDALTTRAIARHAAVGAADRERVHRLFEYVVRNIQLPVPGTEPLPASLYEVALLGRGTAHDRAWLFAELAGQLRLDAVVLSAGGSDEASPDAPLLVGVVVEKDLLLFDPQLGLPLGDPALAPATAAGLAELKAHRDWLDGFGTAAAPYWLTSEKLDQLSVSLIGSSCVWAPRMELLQSAFSGERAMEIFRAIDAQAARLQMVLQPAEGAPPQTFAVWGHPEAQLAGSLHRSATQVQRMENLTDSWKAPLVVVPRQETQTAAVVPKGEHLVGRVAQVRGAMGDAVKNYTVVRMGRVLKSQLNDPRAERLLDRAAEEALYWTALSKSEEQSDGADAIAADRLRQYLKEYPEGIWADDARGLLVEHLIAAGKKDEALALVQEMSADNPRTARYRLLAERWQPGSGT